MNATPIGQMDPNVLSQKPPNTTSSPFTIQTNKSDPSNHQPIESTGNQPHKRHKSRDEQNQLDLPSSYQSFGSLSGELPAPNNRNNNKNRRQTNNRNQRDQPQKKIGTFISFPSA